MRESETGLNLSCTSPILSSRQAWQEWNIYLGRLWVSQASNTIKVITSYEVSVTDSHKMTRMWFSSVRQKSQPGWSKRNQGTNHRLWVSLDMRSNLSCTFLSYFFSLMVSCINTVLLCSQILYPAGLEKWMSGVKVMAANHKCTNVC